MNILNVAVLTRFFFFFFSTTVLSYWDFSYGNSGRFPRGKPATTESHYPTYDAHTHNKAELRPKGLSEKAESYPENLWNEI